MPVCKEPIHPATGRRFIAFSSGNCSPLVWICSSRLQRQRSGGSHDDPLDEPEDADAVHRRCRSGSSRPAGLTSIELSGERRRRCSRLRASGDDLPRHCHTPANTSSHVPGARDASRIAKGLRPGQPSGPPRQIPEPKRKQQSDSVLLELSCSRQRLGSLLVWAGSRLIGNKQVALELTHE